MDRIKDASLTFKNTYILKVRKARSIRGTQRPRCVCVLIVRLLILVMGQVGGMGLTEIHIIFLLV